MTIYEVKRRLVGNDKYFDRATLKFFGQTLASFRVYKLSETRYRVTAPITDKNGNRRGYSEKVFDTQTNTFE